MTRDAEHSDTSPSLPPSAPSAASPSLADRNADPNEQLPGSGLRVRIDPGVEQLVGSTCPVVLLGGSPLKLLRLNPPADAVFATLARGGSLGEAAVDANRSIRSVARFTRKLLDGGFVHPRWDGSGTAVRPDTDTGTETDTASVEDPFELTIVIPAFQRARELDRLLDSLADTVDTADTADSADSAGPPTFEIVVVDDGSTDDTATVAKRRGARIIRHESPQGPAAARNAGLATVTTQFVAFLDSDCVVSENWLRPLMAHFRDPQVALVAPRIGGLTDPSAAPDPKPERRRGHALRAYENVRSSLDLGEREAPVVPRTRVAYVPAAAMVARTSIMNEVGGFTTTMHVGEDVDLVWRLHGAGHRCRYEPASIIHHDHRTTALAFLKRRFQYGTSAAELARRHPGQVPPLAVSGWSALAWSLLATMQPATVAASIAVAVGSTAALPRKLTSVANPGKLAARLALRGHLGAGRQIGAAIWRSYLPLAIVGALASRRMRFTVLAAALIPNLLEWKERRPELDPVRYVGIRIADDAAYCAGVWRGCAHAKSFAALKPDLTSWPGRREPSADRIGSPHKTSER